MTFERIEVAGLSHYSYVLACPADGHMVVVDPKRDIEDYLALARNRKLRISHVLETHIHADYASGAHELIARTDAVACMSGYDDGETFQVHFPHRDLFDGDVIEIGSIRIVALHTPGHTPEHMSFLVYDQSRTSDAPLAMLSGDFLFVGSLGRPDLLGEDAKRALAKRLYHSSREKLRNLPDGMEIHPAHGAGSLCGSGMSGRPSSTLGYERLANPYLDPSLDEEAFVERILGTVPPFPEYYRRMKKLNADGPQIIGDDADPEPMNVDQVAALLDRGHVIIDLRDQYGFCGGHIPGSFGIDTGPSLPVWASWVVPYETPIVLVARTAKEASTSAAALRRVGLDEVVGYLDGGIDAWIQSGRPIEQVPILQPRELHVKMEAGESIRVIDVRSDSEWDAGHIDGATHLFAGTIANRIDCVASPDDTTPMALVCGSGYRSTVAISVLRRLGYRNLLNVAGGMSAWRREHLPVIHGKQAMPA